MRTLLALAALAVAAPAQAATYTYEIDLAVPLNAPPASVGSGAVSWDVGWIQATGLANNIKVASDWAPLSCHKMADKDIVIVMSGTDTTWPTSLPTGNEAKCSYSFGGDTYELTIKLSAGADYSWLETSVYDGATNGWTVTHDGNGYRFGYEYLPDPPAGYAYTEEVTFGVKTGGDQMAGLWCKVAKFTGHKATLGFRAHVETIGASDGFCRVRRTNGTQTQVINVPVNFNEL